MKKENETTTTNCCDSGYKSIVDLIMPIIPPFVRNKSVVLYDMRGNVSMMYVTNGYVV